MEPINAFVDTNIVNRILDIDTIKVDDPNNPKYEEDRLYLSRIIKDYVEKGIVRLIVNPSVKQEIENTKNPQRRGQLLAKLRQFHFTSYNKTIFPFTFPAKFVNEDEIRIIAMLCEKIRDFKKDEKIFIDAVSNSDIDILLTTDREHLADKELNVRGISVVTPKEFVDRYVQIRMEKSERN